VRPTVLIPGVIQQVKGFKMAEDFDRDQENRQSVISWFIGKLPGLCGYLIAVGGCLAFLFFFDKVVHVRPADYGIVQFYREFLGRMLGTQEGRYWGLWITLAVLGPYLLFQIIALVIKGIKAPDKG
jgi:hypothetical protein